jgi:hypothetical protein
MLGSIKTFIKKKISASSLKDKLINRLCIEGVISNFYYLFLFFFIFLLTITGDNLTFCFDLLLRSFNFNYLDISCLSIPYLYSSEAGESQTLENTKLNP